MPGETATIVVEMNNGSRAAIHHVSLRLVRRLRLGTRGQGTFCFWFRPSSLPPFLSAFSYPFFRL